MARYVQELVLNKPDDFVSFIMNDYLQKNQFSMSDWHGEPAYRAGDAMMEGFKYLKWSYAGGVFHLEAWMKGTVGGEWDLDGFVGTLSKKPYKNSLEDLLRTLQQPLPVQQGPMGGQPMNGPTGARQVNGPMGLPTGQPIPVRTVDNTSAANMALVFGILSLVSAFLIPIVSILLGCVGFGRARMGSGSSQAGKAKAGKVLCIIGVCVAIIMWILNIMITLGRI
ncbi:MAG: DUF4190 domain-containing protein [Coprococcus sp.]|nr:DUF4190 domain-containing protein [Coprococcus sp.]